MRITVDGADVDVPDAASILHALRAVGIDLPSLCDDPRLEPYGECRMCLVRIDGGPQPVAACAVRVVAGMSIETAPADIESARRGILEMTARHYPSTAVVGAPDEPFVEPGGFRTGIWEETEREIAKRAGSLTPTEVKDQIVRLVMSL